MIFNKLVDKTFIEKGACSIKAVIKQGYIKALRHRDVYGTFDKSLQLRTHTVRVESAPCLRSARTSKGAILS